MAVKTKFSEKDLIKILSDYNLGEYKLSKPIKSGTVQTNILVNTAKGKFVFRYYECRSKDQVLFEANLISYLEKHKYPCPKAFRNKHGKFVSTYNKKPYIIFEFAEGKHVEKPNSFQRKELIREVAKLHIITKGYKPSYTHARWNYNPELCYELAKKESEKINTNNSKAKLKWLKYELKNLKLPKSLSKGVCHADFHFSNVLFKGDKLSALLDFDDANYTFLMFDLVGLMESHAWHHKSNFNFKKAKEVVSEYTKYRKLNNNEKRHLFDVYKLSILIDCVWFFKRGNVKDFYEKRKIEFLDNIGRDEFYKRLFI